MIEIKKLEDKEVVFLNDKTTKEQDMEFSRFLKNRKSKKTSPKRKRMDTDVTNDLIKSHTVAQVSDLR